MNSKVGTQDQNALVIVYLFLSTYFYYLKQWENWFGSAAILNILGDQNMVQLVQYVLQL